jgi:type II secretory pathway component PulC
MKLFRAGACLGPVILSALLFDPAVAAEQEPSPSVLSNPIAAQSLDHLSATLDRPLFSPSRTPPAPPPPPRVADAPVPTPPSPPPNLVLYGVVLDGETARAVVRANNKTLRAQIGDDIDGWKVSQIEGRKVVLSLDGRLATFTLFSRDRERQKSDGAPIPASESKNSPVQATAQTVTPQPVQPGKRRRSRE